MPKVISNLDKNGVNPDGNKFPSLACNLTSQGKLVSDRLYCCCGNSCSDKFDLSNCTSSCTISQCRNIVNMDACQKRTDANAQQVCNWKGDYFCLSDPGTDLSHGEQFEAIKWSVSRNKLEESINWSNPSGQVTACYNGTGFQLSSWPGCDSTTYGSVTCGDLFSSNYICNWKGNNSESINRYPLGEVCETISAYTALSSTTSTATVTNFVNNKGVETGLGIGFGLATLLAIGGFAWVYKIKRGIPSYL